MVHAIAGISNMTGGMYHDKHDTYHNLTDVEIFTFASLISGICIQCTHITQPCTAHTYTETLIQPYT